MENKYHKIVSMVLLLFLIITIQHYSNKYVGKLITFVTDERPSAKTITVLPSISESVVFPSLSPSKSSLKTCSQEVCQVSLTKKFLKSS